MKTSPGYTQTLARTLYIVVDALIVSLAFLLSFTVQSASDEDVFKYHPKTPINLIDTDWRGELFDTNGQSLGIFLAQDFASKSYLAQNDRKYLNPIPDKLQLWQSRECRSGQMLAYEVNKSGDVLYYLEDNVFRTGCIPGAYFIELKAINPSTIEVVVSNFEYKVLATGSLKPDDNSKTMVMLSQEIKEANDKLTLVTDNYIGYWSGKFEGEWIDLAFKFSDIRLTHRRSKSGEVIILSPEKQCYLHGEFRKARYNHNYNQQLEKEGVDLEQYWFEYVNSIRLSKLDRLKPNGKHCNKSKLINRKNINEYSTLFFLQPDGKLKVTFKKPAESPKVVYFEKSTISKYVNQIVQKDPYLRAYFNSRIMKMYTDVSYPFKHYWQDSVFFSECGTGPYCRFTAGLYLDAIYRGDFKKLSQIEELMGVGHLKPVVDFLLGDYIYFYPEDYGSCLQADYNLKVGTEFTNSFGGNKREMVSTYRYNKKFKQACEIVCKFRGISDVMRLGIPLHDQARAGLEQSMSELRCDDPAVQQFERNLLKYFNKVHNLK